jgi:hypothetical protein
MASMAWALIIAGTVVHLVGYIWLVFIAYEEAPKAGRVAIFVWPLAMLVPLMRWDEKVMKAMVLAIAGLAMTWGGNRLFPPDPPPTSLMEEFPGLK